MSGESGAPLGTPASGVNAGPMWLIILISLINVKMNNKKM